MTTINQIRASLESARSYSYDGDFLNSARIALATQRMAAASRSSYADDIGARAHALVDIALSNSENADHATRSELGRIRAESLFLFNGK